MFRKKGLVYTAVILGILVIYDIFFLNMTVKWAVQEAGKRVFMARVDIASVKVDVMKSKLTIKGLAVGDRNKEFKNLFETSEITADYMFLPLLEGKVIIDNVSVLDLVLASDRKTSGFLPPAEIKKIEKEQKDAENSFAGKLLKQAGDKATSEIQKMPVAKLGDLKDVKNLDYKKYINKENLETYKAAADAQAKVTAAKAQAEASIKAVDADAKVKAAQASIAKVKETKISGVKDLGKAQEALAELDKIRKDADELTKSAAKAKDDSQALVDAVKQSADAVNDAKEKDVQNVMSKVNINILDAKSVEKALIGPVWYERVEKVLQIIQLANKYIPVIHKKKDKITVVKRGAGREVIFLYDARYPSFWIKKVVLSTSGGGASRYYMKGEIHDIALEQSITGKPLTWDLKLDNPSQTIELTGSIYHVDGRDDSVTASVSGLPASASGLDKVDFGGIRITSAKTGYNIKARSTDEALTLNGTIAEKNVVFAGDDKNNISYQVLSGIDAFNVNIEMKGADKSSGMSVTSDIGDKLKKSIDRIYGKKVAEAKAAVQKAVEDAVKDELSKVTKLGDTAKEGVTSQLKALNGKTSGLQSEIDKAKADITKKMAGGGGNNLLKGLFK